MKVNIPVRIKNPWFWVGVGSVVFSAAGVSPETFTNWDAVLNAFMSILSNPFQMGSVILSILAVFIDPTTAGISDSDRALNYKTPLKGDKNG